MNPFSSLPVRDVKHFISDGQSFPIDKEYAEMGMDEEWLMLFRIVEYDNHSEYYYLHI